MQEQKQVAPEDLEEINQIQQESSELYTRYGELHFQKRVIEASIEELTDAIAQLEEKRSALVEKIQSKYGIGSVNLETGTFTPA